MTICDLNRNRAILDCYYGYGRFKTFLGYIIFMTGSLFMRLQNMILHGQIAAASLQITANRDQIVKGTEVRLFSEQKENKILLFELNSSYCLLF